MKIDSIKYEVQSEVINACIKSLRYEQNIEIVNIFIEYTQRRRILNIKFIDYVCKIFMNDEQLF